MTLPVAVIVVYPGEPECDFIGPYNEYAVADLKTHLPYWVRSWDPARKVWKVRRDRLAEFLDIIDPYYTYFVFDSTNQFGDTAPPPPLQSAPPPTNTVWSALHLSPGAPKEVVRAAYRALAALHHPDAGGDTATMAKINDAYDRIMKP